MTERVDIGWNRDGEISVDGGVWRAPTPAEATLRELLRGLVAAEDQPCSFDHHGYCQEHGWDGEPGECYVRLARAAVGITRG